ncbi:MAG: 4Fe-4S cluster-binding domain-containing protein [Desulfovibrionaceae bacterium]|nr:4Fe-4S cluster-binding domain-containing protein [Desulfovibrionaceae bacterium]
MAPSEKSQNSLQLAGIIDESIVDGPGLRFVIFTQGCQHFCPGCQNPSTHPLTGGTWYEINDLVNMYRENPLLAGMTFSGGEPFLQAKPLSQLAKEVHSLGGDIVTYTGYVYEDLKKLAQTDCSIGELLAETDLLIDGPYIEGKRDLELLFRGSQNQRLLDRAARAQIDANMDFKA